jgi:hypothetical protein
MALWSDLDAATRYIVARSGLRIAFILMVAATAGSANARPLLGFAQALELGCYCFSLSAGCRALMKRERLQAASLNGWDEAVAFGLVALLSHVTIRFVQ